MNKKILIGVIIAVVLILALIFIWAFLPKEEPFVYEEEIKEDEITIEEPLEQAVRDTD